MILQVFQLLIFVYLSFYKPHERVSLKQICACLWLLMRPLDFNFLMELYICMPRAMNWKRRYYTVKISSKQLTYDWSSPFKSNFKSGYFEPQFARFRLLKLSVLTPCSCKTLYWDLKKRFLWMIFSQNSLEKQGICTSEIISKTCISKTVSNKGSDGTMTIW